MNDWLPIPRISRDIPFGYRVDEKNEKVLIPIPKELDLLEEAKKHLKQYPYREVSDWLSARSGRYISHMGLKKRVDNELRRRQGSRSVAKWAERTEKKRAKAEALIKERLGARADPNDTQLSFDFGEF